MTGLDVDKCRIIEIACFITDRNLNLVDKQGFEEVVYQPKKLLDAMDDWNQTHHSRTGLIQKVLNADPVTQSADQVDKRLFEYITKFIPKQRSALLAGNTVFMDRNFMVREFSTVVNHLHYRLIDVSSISEVCKRFHPQVSAREPRKKKDHSAKSDILESIEQLRWFKDNYLGPK